MDERQRRKDLLRSLARPHVAAATGLPSRGRGRAAAVGATGAAFAALGLAAARLLGGQQAAASSAAPPPRLDARPPVAAFKAPGEGGALAWRPDSTMLAVGGGYEDPAVTLWEAPPSGNGAPAADRRPLRRLAGLRKMTFALAWRPDGRALAGLEEGRILLWDAGSGRLLRTVTASVGNGTALAFSPDGRVLAAAAGPDSDALGLWSAEDGRLLRTLPAPPGEPNDEIIAAHFSPDGRRVLTSGGPAAVLWDAKTGARLGELRDDGGAGGGGGGTVLNAALSPDGRRIALKGGAGAASSAAASVTLWDARTGRLVRRLRDRYTSAYHLAFSPDGRVLVTSGATADPSVNFFPVPSTRTDIALLVWDADSGRPLLSLSAAGGSILRAAFSPDGRYLAVGAGDGTVRLWPAPRPRAQAGAAGRGRQP